MCLAGAVTEFMEFSDKNLQTFRETPIKPPSVIHSNVTPINLWVNL